MKDGKLRWTSCILLIAILLLYGFLFIIFSLSQQSDQEVSISLPPHSWRNGSVRRAPKPNTLLLFSVNNTRIEIPIWTFDASKHLYVSIIVLKRFKDRMRNSKKLCAKIVENKVTCELFDGFDATNKGKKKLCTRFTENGTEPMFTRRYCRKKAKSLAKIGDIVSKYRLFTYILSNIFDHNQDHQLDVKYFLLLEDDAIINHDFIDVLNSYVNELIQYKTNEYILNYLNKTQTKMNINNIANIRFTFEEINTIKNQLQLRQFETISSFFNIFQLYAPHWCFNRQTQLQTQLKTKSNNLYFYSNTSLFAATTAVLFDQISLKFILQHGPFNKASDKFIAKMLMEEQVAPFKPLQAFAICPSIVGEMGGKSTLFANKTHPYRSVGWQIAD